MWTLLRKLSSCQCTSLTKLELTLSPFSLHVDYRNCYTYFEDAAKLLSTVRSSLQSLTVSLGDIQPFRKVLRGTPARVRTHLTRSWHRNLATDFLRCLLEVYNRQDFPLLEEVVLKGFCILNRRTKREPDPNLSLASFFELDRDDLFLPEESIVPEVKPLWSPVFNGYNYDPDADTLQEFEEAQWDS